MRERRRGRGKGESRIEGRGGGEREIVGHRADTGESRRGGSKFRVRAPKGLRASGMAMAICTTRSRTERAMEYTRSRARARELTNATVSYRSE
jgi:hypothetical protein